MSSANIRIFSFIFGDCGGGPGKKGVRLRRKNQKTLFWKLIKRRDEMQFFFLRILPYPVKREKNLWRRKCVRRAIFRNVEVRVEGAQHVQLCHCATCQGSSYTRNEYNLFYQKFDSEYFFIQQFFRKKLYFQRKQQKTVLVANLTIFRGKGAF